MLTRESILGSDDLPRKPVSVPEWGGTVCLRQMTAGEREKWERVYNDDSPSGIKAREQIRAFVAVLSVCDEDGKPLFTEADIPALCTKSGAALDRIFTKFLRLNKVAKADIDELEGNSVAGPSNDSSSTSQSV